MTSKQIALSSACTEKAAAFEEREGGRFCHRCEKMQYDLRDATRREALAVLERSGGRACGRVRRGPGGEPRFKAEAPSRVGTAVRGAALALVLAACDSPADDATPTTATASGTVDDPSIDHSTDTSADPDHHLAHAHAHDPVTVDLGEGRHEEYDGEMTMVDVRDLDPVPPMTAVVPPTTTTTGVAPPPSSAPSR